MKKTAFRWLALCLALVFALTGCEPLLPQLTNPETEPQIVAFADMEYTRQDVAELENLSQAIYDSIEAGEDVPTLMEKVFAFYEAYNHYYTAYALANIHYSKDVTNSQWEEEYTYCLETSSNVDALLDNLLYALADHPEREALEAEEYFGEGFFDSYEGESIWDETFTALSNQEAELQARYYEVSGKAANVSSYSEGFYMTYGAQLADIYVELVKVRQEMAEYAGYEDFASFAYAFYFSRDYTPGQAMQLMADIEQLLVPLYLTVDYTPLYDLFRKECKEADTFNYVQSCAKNMGGVMEEAFNLMHTAGLYDITYSTKKYDASFEMYLMDYNQPYVFVNPTKMVYDKLTFTHEFGHFCNDYAAQGSNVGIDVAEFFSQGLEYLSLDYATGGQSLTGLKMVDSLCLYVEQTAYSVFEHEVYQLKGDELTRENVYAIYKDVGNRFGFAGSGWDYRSFVLVPHFFISPMYIISYVVSNDAAMQLYQLEQSQKGAGLSKYTENLATTEYQFLGFIQAAGLESPFDPGRIQKVRQTFLETMQ